MGATGGEAGAELAGQGGETFADGAAELSVDLSAQDNSAWISQPPADWNLTVDYLSGQVTGGGMAPFSLKPLSATLPSRPLPWPNR